MIAVRVEGATRTLGAPTGWNPATSGICGVLPIRDELLDETLFMSIAHAREAVAARGRR